MKPYAAVLSVLALTACASDPEMPMAAAPPAVRVQVPGGDWAVADYPAGEAAETTASPYAGQLVTLNADRAVDPAGRVCLNPVYSAVEGLPAPDAAPRQIVAVTCEGMPFLTLVSQPDGTWLTRTNAWVLKLSKAESPPAPAPAPAVAPVAIAPEAAPAVEVPIPAPAAAPEAKPQPKQNGGTLVYLASYKTEKGAQAGYAILARHSALLAKQKPVIQSVDLGKKGTWVRLYALAADEAERGQICHQVGKRVDECGARNRE